MLYVTCISIKLEEKIKRECHQSGEYNFETVPEGLKSEYINSPSSLCLEPEHLSKFFILISDSFSGQNDFFHSLGISPFLYFLLHFVLNLECFLLVNTLLCQSWEHQVCYDFPPPFIHPLTHLFIPFNQPAIHPSVHSFIHPSMDPSILPFISPSNTCPFIRSSTHLSIHLLLHPITLDIYLSIQQIFSGCLLCAGHWEYTV